MSRGALLEVVQAAPARARRYPLEQVRLTDPQRNFVEDARRVLLWRDGHQIGKSYALAYFVVAFALRRLAIAHKWTGPLKILVLGYSYAQMDPLLGKIWSLLPKDLIDPHVQYRERQGFTGYKQQHVCIFDSPDAARAYGKRRKSDAPTDDVVGLVAVIALGTYEAGASAIMGGTQHLVVMDEPCPEDVYSEAVTRVTHYHGCIRIGFTPTPTSPPLAYMKKLVDDGKLAQFGPHGVSEAVCTPRGGLIELPFRLQAHIDEWAGTLLSHEREMRLKGDWFPSLEGAWLTNFSDASVVAFDFGDHLGPPEGANIGIGIDYGIAAGKQCAVLMAVAREWSPKPLVWFIAESGSDGRTTPEQDAQAILSMLDAHLGYLARTSGAHPYDLVDAWIGDRNAMARKVGRMGGRLSKGNAQTRRCLAEILRRPKDEIKWIDTPTKYRGSPEDGMRALNAVFGRRLTTGIPHCLVHPRCKRLIQGMREWKGDPRDPVKDMLDAGRYVFEEMSAPNPEARAETTRYALGGR